jgi:hypothetical protein
MFILMIIETRDLFLLPILKFCSNPVCLSHASTFAPVLYFWAYFWNNNYSGAHTGAQLQPSLKILDLGGSQ